MNNETDLDWLARTEHHWPKDAVYVSRHENAVEWHYVELSFKGRGHFTKHQWLARRAELQNKPSWEDAPEWAQWLGQDEDGVWYWHGEEPNSKGEDVNGCCYWMSRGLSDIASRGELLGDWRDTLERRPDRTRAEMEVELVKAAFEPFTRIEDNQELPMSKQQETQQDNGWFERGELPPVGTSCEIHHQYWSDDGKFEVVKISAITKEYLIVEYERHEQHYNRNDISFRPIRTERDELMDVIVSQGFLSKDGGFCGQIADTILAAGFKRDGGAV